MPVVLAAPLVELFAAVAILLLAWAVTILLVRPIVVLLEHVPLIGGTVAQAVNDVANTVISWAVDWAKQGVDALVQLVAIPIGAILDLFSQLGGLADAIEAALANVASVAAGAVGAVADRLASAVARIASLANALAAAVNNIATLFERVAAIVAHAIPDAIAALRSAILSTVNRLLDALEGVLRAAIAAVKPWALLAIAAALAPIQALLALVPAQIAQAIAVAVRPLTLGLEGLGEWARGAIGAITSRLGILEGLLPLLALVPLVGIIPRTISEFWRTKTGCVDPTCDLLGGLLNGLGAAGELLTGSVLIYLVEESISNPAGAAAEVHGWHDELASLASGVTTVLAGRSV